MIERAYPVFLSVGQTFQREHELLIEHVQIALAQRDIAAQTLPREHWNFDAPILSVQTFMRQCYGVIVVAFPRIRFEAVLEWPDSMRQREYGGREVASVWLQIEAALAFALDLPTLIMVDSRLHPEGLLNPKHRAYNAISYDAEQCTDRLPIDVLTALDAFARSVRDSAGSRASADNEPQ